MTKALLRRVSILLSLPLFAMTAGLDAHHETLCKGIIEENDWQVPITLFQVGGISESQFNKVLDKFEAKFKPVVASYGGRLDLRRLWSNSTVNANANRSGSTYTINMYGGLARHSAITQDGLMLVACHELGHHIGGSPKRESYWGGGTDWASNEGQSDYYAGLRCLRQVWSAEENFTWYEGARIDSAIKESCELTWNTQEEELSCMRIGMAGKSVANLFKSLRGERTSPDVETPDNRVVSSMVHDHPATQCRMDTYYQAALCVHDMGVKLSDRDAKVGACNAKYTEPRNGSRPRCWYKPS